jgi:ADP-ribose pyrophosphatase YjhB (NUDIX family)/GNAT superfamily N-acetyltransferase
MQIHEASDPTTIARCFSVMVHLRPTLTPNDFLERVEQQRREVGYRLVYLEDKGEIKSVAGFVLRAMLSRGRFLYVDDLVTRAEERSKGYGGLMYDWLIEEARRLGCQELHLDSGIQREEAHRFYLRRGMHISGYHFAVNLSEQPVELPRVRQPFMTTADRQRRFSCSAVAVQAVLVNDREEVLLLSHPVRNQGESWQVVSGALEAEETVLEGTLREVAEEVGPKVQVRPLGTVHVQTFHYDPHVQFMIGIYYLLAYEGGPIEPGDDMAGSRYRWWSLDELADEQLRLQVPPDQTWLLRRAVAMYRLWRNETIELDPLSTSA